MLYIIYNSIIFNIIYIISYLVYVNGLWNTHTHTHILDFKEIKEVINLKKSMEGYMRVAVERKGKWQVYYVTKDLLYKVNTVFHVIFFLKKISNQILTKYWWIEERSKITNCCRELEANFSAQ